jgi:hypothetical protein
MKKVLPIIFILLLLLLVPVYTLIDKSAGEERPLSYRLINFWHIESFEGGAYSRAGWLRARLREFERSNKGVIVRLNVLTNEQLREAVNRGEGFDVVSFSLGAGEKVLSKVLPYSGKINVRSDLCEYGKVMGVQMAVPYLLGGYALFTYTYNLERLPDKALINNIFNGIERKGAKGSVTKLNGLDFGLGECNLPLLSLIVNDAPEGNVQDTDKTQYQAYENFLRDATSTVFLGTQRDLGRIDYRVRNQKLSPVTYQFLEGFSDLVQYLALGSACETALRLIEYLTTDRVQDTIRGLEMFGVNNKKIHTDDAFVEMEKAISKPLKSINVFTSEAIIKEIAEKTYRGMANAGLRKDILVWF